jgi:Zn-finger nucleic acid-binding protein
METLREFLGESKPGGEPANCPQCQLALTPSTLSGEEVLLCSRCNGVWLSFDCFDKVPHLPEADVAPFQDPPDTELSLKASRSPRACPNCARPMINFHFRQEVWLDWCDEGHGMWLDRGEMALVHRIREQSQALSEEQKQGLRDQVGAIKHPTE